MSDERLGQHGERPDDDRSFDEGAGRGRGIEPRTAGAEPQGTLGGHPRGTLAIVAAYGLLFGLGWVIIYFFVFVPRGAVTP